MNVANIYDCANIGVDSLGEANKFAQHIVPWALGTCYIFVNITFTLEVATSRLSTYLSARVIEDQTPLNEVNFEPSPWVQQSFWLLPDLMTIISLAKSSQLLTWQNVDLYTENLIRQPYLAAWDSFHESFDEGGVLSSATLVESKIQATVSCSRISAWLGLSLLTSFAGVLLLLLIFTKGWLNLSGSGAAAQPKELKDILNDLASLNFF